MDKVKKVLSAIKNWIVGNGIEGVAGIGAGLALWIFGYKILAGVAFGIFVHKNWDLAKNAIKGKL